MQGDKVVVMSQPWDAALFPNFKNEVKKARPRMVVCFAPGNTTGNEATELTSTKDTLRFLDQVSKETGASVFVVPHQDRVAAYQEAFHTIKEETGLEGVFDTTKGDFEKTLLYTGRAEQPFDPPLSRFHVTEDGRTERIAWGPGFYVSFLSGTFHPREGTFHPEDFWTPEPKETIVFSAESPSFPNTSTERNDLGYAVAATQALEIEVKQQGSNIVIPKRYQVDDIIDNPIIAQELLKLGMAREVFLSQGNGQLENVLRTQRVTKCISASPNDVLHPVDSVGKRIEEGERYSNLFGKVGPAHQGLYSLVTMYPNLGDISLENRAVPLSTYDRLLLQNRRNGQEASLKKE